MSLINRFVLLKNPCWKHILGSLLVSSRPNELFVYIIFLAACIFGAKWIIVSIFVVIACTGSKYCDLDQTNERKENIYCIQSIWYLNDNSCWMAPYYWLRKIMCKVWLVCFFLSSCLNSCKRYQNHFSSDQWVKPSLNLMNLNCSSAELRS